MPGTSNSVVALAKKMAKPETKTVTRTATVPKTKIVKQEPQLQATPKDTERTDLVPIHQQPTLLNQRNQSVTTGKTLKTAGFVAVWLWLRLRRTDIVRRYKNTHTPILRVTADIKKRAFHSYSLPLKSRF